MKRKQQIEEIALCLEEQMTTKHYKNETNAYYILMTKHYIKEVAIKLVKYNMDINEYLKQKLEK
jgi:hypothetical protein